MNAHLTILTGASRGLGLAMARQLLQPGRTLLCISRQVSDELAQEAERRGAPLVQWSQDLADGATAAARLSLWLAGQPAGHFASATLINNAGVRKRLNVSSGLGRRPMASQAGYCAAKAGMDHFTRCLALEKALKPRGARVCALAPGVVDTDMQVQLRGADPAEFPDRDRFAGLKAAGQLSTPAEAAARVLAYLARPDFGAEPVADVRG